MALKKDIEIIGIYNENIIVKDSLIKINNIEGNKNILQITIYIYDIKDNIVAIKYEKFNPELNTINFIAQAYEYLKTIDEFKDSEDC